MAYPERHNSHQILPLTPSEARKERRRLRREARKAISDKAHDMVARQFRGGQHHTVLLVLENLIGAAGGAGVCPLSPREVAEMVRDAYACAGWTAKIRQPGPGHHESTPLPEGIRVTSRFSVHLRPEAPRITHINCPPDTPYVDISGRLDRGTHWHAMAFEPRQGDTRPRTGDFMPIEDMARWAPLWGGNKFQDPSVFALPNPLALPGELLPGDVSIFSIARQYVPADKKPPEGVIEVEGPWQDKAALYYGSNLAMKEWAAEINDAIPDRVEGEQQAADPDDTPSNPTE